MATKSCPCTKGAKQHQLSPADANKTPLFIKIKECGQYIPLWQLEGSASSSEELLLKIKKNERKEELSWFVECEIINASTQKSTIAPGELSVIFKNTDSGSVTLAEEISIDPGAKNIITLESCITRSPGAEGLEWNVEYKGSAVLPSKEEENEIKKFIHIPDPNPYFLEMLTPTYQQIVAVNVECPPSGCKIDVEVVKELKVGPLMIFADDFEEELVLKIQISGPADEVSFKLSRGVEDTEGKFSVPAAQEGEMIAIKMKKEEEITYLAQKPVKTPPFIAVLGRPATKKPLFGTGGGIFGKAKK